MNLNNKKRKPVTSSEDSSETNRKINGNTLNINGNSKTIPKSRILSTGQPSDKSNSSSSSSSIMNNKNNLKNNNLNNNDTKNNKNFIATIDVSVKQTLKEMTVDSVRKDVNVKTTTKTVTNNNNNNDNNNVDSQNKLIVPQNIPLPPTTSSDDTNVTCTITPKKSKIHQLASPHDKLKLSPVTSGKSVSAIQYDCVCEI